MAQLMGMLPYSTCGGVLYGNTLMHIGALCSPCLYFVLCSYVHFDGGRLWARHVSTSATWEGQYHPALTLTLP